MPNQPTMKFVNKGRFNTSSLILALIPSIFFGMAVLMVVNFYPFYQSTTDPEYFHLLNGINIALFNLAAPYTDHPGTPLQLIVAISSWPLSFFMPGSLVENVIDHPELFLKGAIITKNFIIALVLLIVGLRVLAITKNVWLALLVQMLPFGSAYTMTVIGRLTPEGFIIVPVALILLLLTRYLYNDTGVHLSNKNIKHFALIGGLGMAIKFSYLPFLLIPVFMLKSFRLTIRYGLLAVVSTLIFAFPILFNFTKTMSWFGNMAMNSGQWGGGESTFIEWGEVPARLYQLLTFDFLFTGLLLVLAGLFIYSRFINKSKAPGLHKLNLISAGVLLGIIFSVFLITKHFAYRYYVSTLLFQLVVFYLIFEYSIRLFQFRMLKKYLPIIAFTFYLMIVIVQIPGFIKLIDNTALSHKKYTEWSYTVESERKENIPLIISSFYAGCPFPEFSLNNAYLLCGHLKSTFSDKLREKYPKSIMYVGWSEKFYHWNYFWDAPDFVDPEMGVYIFIGKDKKEDLDVILERLQKVFPGYSPNPELLQHSNIFDESFYRLSFKSN